MKKIFLISIIYLFSTNILIADEHKCSGMKKLSKEYLACTAKNIKEGAVYIDNTTASANIARELYKEAKTKGFDFLDAPISGGQAGAEGGTLTVMVGGDEITYKKAEPIIDCYSKKIKLLGGQSIPTLNEVIEIIPENIFLNIELKGKNTALETNKIIIEHISMFSLPPSKFIISSFRWDELIKFRNANQDVPIATLVDSLYKIDDAIKNNEIYFLTS